MTQRPHRKVFPSGGHAPGAAMSSSYPDPHWTARDCTPAEVGLRLETSLQRQLFDVARTGEFQAFKSLLRKKRRTAVGDINFQYRAKLSEEGESTLWPWYWCVDPGDSVALSWGAPSGIEPETGDTLLIITLKIGMEEHVKCILEHRDVDLDVRNSSGQDAAGVAATCGRESLISHLLVRRNLEQRRMKPSFKGQHRFAQLQHRQLPLGTRRALRARARARRSRRKSTSSELSPSHNDTDHLHAHRMSVTAEATILCQGKSENLENRRVCAITDGVPVAPKHTSGTENTAGLLVEAQDDGTDHDAAQHADNESRSNKIGDKNSHCLAACEPLQPPSDTTRAIAVQTDREVLQARDMQEIAVAAPASPQPAAGFRASGILHHPPLGRIPEGARLQRRSTAPGDLFSVSRRFKRPRPLPTESEEDVGGREVHARQRIAGASPGTNEATLTMEVDRGRAPVSGTTEHDLSGLCSEGTVFRTDLRQIEIEASSAVAPTDERGEPPARDTPHGAANIGDLASQQQQMPAPSGCLDDSGLVAVDAGSPPGAVDPSLERRNKVDEVTRELQRLLREDALQDDGGW